MMSYVQVYVEPSYRERGLFKALYKHVRSEAKTHGVAGLRLYADVGNKKAHLAVSR